jgi:hypothetical protein
VRGGEIGNHGLTLILQSPEKTEQATPVLYKVQKPCKVMRELRAEKGEPERGDRTWSLPTTGGSLRSPVVVHGRTGRPRDRELMGQDPAEADKMRGEDKMRVLITEKMR